MPLTDKATVMLVPVPEQIVPVPSTVKPMAGNGLTVTVAVPVNWAEQVVATMVANTLKVVVEPRLPVGKLMVPPVPAIGVPTLTLPELFLNW